MDFEVDCEKIVTISKNDHFHVANLKIMSHNKSKATLKGGEGLSNSVKNNFRFSILLNHKVRSPETISRLK